MNAGPLTPDRYVESAAIVRGAEAFLLARVLRSPPVAAFLTKARWFEGRDMYRTIEAIERAGRDWEKSLDLPQRDTASRSQPGQEQSTWTAEEAAEHLNF